MLSYSLVFTIRRSIFQITISDRRLFNFHFSQLFCLKNLINYKPTIVIGVTTLNKTKKTYTLARLSSAYNFYRKVCYNI